MKSKSFLRFKKWQHNNELKLSWLISIDKFAVHTNTYCDV